MNVYLQWKWIFLFFHEARRVEMLLPIFSSCLIILGSKKKKNARILSIFFLLSSPCVCTVHFIHTSSKFGVEHSAYTNRVNYTYTQISMLVVAGGCCFQLAYTHSNWEVFVAIQSQARIHTQTRDKHRSARKRENARNSERTAMTMALLWQCQCIDGVQYNNNNGWYQERIVYSFRAVCYSNSARPMQYTMSLYSVRCRCAAAKV